MSAENLINSFEMAVSVQSSRMFDLTVERYLNNDGTEVVAYMEEIGAVDEDGDTIYQPYVMVNGLTGRNHVRRIMEWTYTDGNFISAVGEEYEEKMASKWEDTIEYYEELDELGRVITQLALDPNASYYSQAENQALELGATEISEAQLIVIARELACTALTEWNTAVEDAKDEVEIIDIEIK